VGGPTSGVPSSPENVISGNLGRGIEVRGDSVSPGSSNQILGNFIGTDISGRAANGTPSNSTGPNVTTYTLGNLSDGVFLLVPQATQIEDNLISGNRATGIRVAVQGGGAAGDLTDGGNETGAKVQGD